MASLTPCPTPKNAGTPDRMAPFVHLSGYKFTPLSGLVEMKARLLELCRARDLCGSILLSAEGINFFVAGVPSAAENLLAELHSIPGLEDMVAKRSGSADRPYDRMRVKIKKEIIAFGVEGIEPARGTSPKISARELKRWLDEGRDVTLLDTRNDYEVRMGTFKGAAAAGIAHFRDFPDAVRRMPDAWKERPLVMFCTGGIRCEKAGPFMERQGFRNVLQLDGGILRYFEECGGAHYDGECFVFDQRVGLDPTLRETHSVMCPQCQMPIDGETRAHPDQVEGVSCPHCLGTPGERLKSQV